MGGGERSQEGGREEDRATRKRGGRGVSTKHREKDRRENKKAGKEKGWGENQLFPRKPVCRTPVSASRMMPSVGSGLAGAGPQTSAGTWTALRIAQLVSRA